MTENDRQEKDYSAVLVNHWIDKARNDLESDEVKAILDKAETFVSEMKKHLESR